MVLCQKHPYNNWFSSLMKPFLLASLIHFPARRQHLHHLHPSGKQNLITWNVKNVCLFPIRRLLGSYENLPNASLKPAHYNKIYKWRQLSMNWKWFLLCQAPINEEGSLTCHSRARGLPILTTCPPVFPCTLRGSWWFLNRPCFVSLSSLLSGH